MTPHDGPVVDAASGPAADARWWSLVPPTAPCSASVQEGDSARVIVNYAGQVAHVVLGTASLVPDTARDGPLPWSVGADSALVAPLQRTPPDIPPDLSTGRQQKTSGRVLTRGVAAVPAQSGLSQRVVRVNSAVPIKPPAGEPLAAAVPDPPAPKPAVKHTYQKRPSSKTKKGSPQRPVIEVAPPVEWKARPEGRFVSADYNTALPAPASLTEESESGGMRPRATGLVTLPPSAEVSAAFRAQIEELSRSWPGSPDVALAFYKSFRNSRAKVRRRQGKETA